MSIADISKNPGETKYEESPAPGFDDPSIEPMKAARAAHEYVTKLQKAFDNKDIDGIANSLSDDGYWRDMLCIDKTDFNSYKKNDIRAGLERHGIPQIKNLKVVRPGDASIVPLEGITWAQAYLTFETELCRGKGYIRLKEENGQFKRAFTLFTTMWEVKGKEEFTYNRRPLGAEIHQGGANGKNWKELRQEKVAFEDSDPTVLIIGGGQNGLMLAARLTVLGISNLIVEKNPNIGDNWANRYHSLVLHDPVYADHFPYISYPINWPVFTPKDKLAAWFKYYAEAMELNVWTNSTVTGGGSYSPNDHKWTIDVVKDGAAPRTMKVGHIVQATGFSGEPRMPKIPGMEKFKGEICHSSKHVGPEKWRGKNAVVVGCCNSGHDIAAGFHEYGAGSVTMVQRSHTYVVSSEHGLPGWLNGFYQENGPQIDDADLMFTSLPVELVEAFHIESTKKIEALDKDMLDGLEAVGFKLNRFNSGLFMKYFRDGGGYYLDVGCSKLIADRKIKIKQGQDIQEITEDGLVFKDGSKLDADIIVLATGYGSMRDATRRLIGEDTANQMRTCWGLDKQHEIQTCWRNSGVPRFWLQAGNFFQARCFSRVLALQIQQIEEGMVPDDAPYPDYKENKDPRF